MKLLQKLLISVSSALVLLIPAAYAHAATTFPVNGGTGSTTLSGIILGAGTAPVQTLGIGSGLQLSGGVLSNIGALFGYPFPGNATSTLLTFSGGISAAGITNSSLGAGTVNSTSAGLQYVTATTSVSSGTGITFTGTAGALIGGSNLTITNAGVISNSCPGGFLSCSGTNPSSFTLGTLSVGNGGTGSTTLGGILKGAGASAIVSAIGNTDYQLPITLTTTGSSGAATFNGVTLNIPQYAGTTYTGTFPISVAGSVISFLGLSTSSPIVSGQPVYATGVNTIASVASSTFLTSIGGQVAGNYITALTGDVTASGPGSVAATLATVNSNVGSFTNANITVNGKGLITAASNGASGSGGSIGTSTALVNGQVDFSTSVNTIGNDSNFLWDNTNKRFGVGSTTPGTTFSLGSTGTNAIANFTNSTSTIYQNLIVGSAQSANPYLQVGGGTTPYGYLANDRMNILGTMNDYIASNIINTNTGACATADFTQANDLASNAAFFNDQGHTSSGFTGIACANNPFTDFGANSSYYFDPTGNMTFALGSTSQAQFQWDIGGYAAASRKMTLTNAGRLGIGTSTPGSLLSIGGNGTGTNFFDNATTTKSGVGGENILQGCYAINGVCLSAGTGTVTGVTGTYPIISSGGTAPVISIAFGTTTSNTWAGTQTFTNSPVFSTLGAGTVNSTSGGAVYNTATTSVTNGTGIGFTGTAGALIGGTSLTITNTGVTSNVAGTGISVSGATGAVTIGNTGVISLGNGTGTTCSGTNPGTCNVNTTQNITTLSNLTVAGFVQTTSGGVLSSATLTSGQVTTALGFTPFGGTNPLPITNGGTGTSTPGLQGQNWIVGPSGVFNATSSLFTSTAGFIGIGTTSPQKPFHVEGTTSGGVARIQRDFTSAPTNSLIGTYDVVLNEIGGVANGTGPAQTFGFMNAGGAENIQADIGSIRDGADTNGSLVLRSYLAGSPQQVATLTSGGSTLIGTGQGTNGATLNVTGTTTTSAAYALNVINSSFGSLLDVRNDGNVGVGTSSPYGLLSLGAPATTNPYLVIGSSTEILKVAPSATTLVGVATTSPWRTLAVTGTVGFDGLTASAGLQAGILCISANKEVINESIQCISSAKRYKENIKDLNVGLDELMKLRPVSFTWKKAYNGALQNDPNYSGTQYSLVADEVQAIDPNLVIVTTASSTFEGKSYPAGTVQGLADVNHWVALFVKSIQELANKQNAQQVEIDELRAEVQALKTGQQVETRCSL